MKSNILSVSAVIDLCRSSVFFYSASSYLSSSLNSWKQERKKKKLYGSDTPTQKLMGSYDTLNNADRFFQVSKWAT